MALERLSKQKRCGYTVASRSPIPVRSGISVAIRFQIGSLQPVGMWDRLPRGSSDTTVCRTCGKCACNCPTRPSGPRSSYNHGRSHKIQPYHQYNDSATDLEVSLKERLGSWRDAMLRITSENFVEVTHLLQRKKAAQEATVAA